VIRITRPTRGGTRLLTAEVFEEMFRRHLGAAFAVDVVDQAEWCRRFMGPPRAPLPLDEAATRFAAACAGADFICPGYESIPLAPLFLALRNRAGSPARLLLISHAAGAYAMEWTLLPPLLAPGDIVVAPSESARATIDFLCPAMAPYVRVVPHPMQPLPAGPRDPRRVVSMGRINAGKLIHRQIDAMDRLRARGHELPRMEIAGALDDFGDFGPHAYGRALGERIRRLGLEDHVRLVGPVRGLEARGAFLSGAALVVNLSTTVEESLPKTPLEALGVGVPVLGTAWDGLHDTVGDCGELVPLHRAGAGIGAVDVDPDAVADAMERLLADPPSPERCRAHAALFSPEVAIAGYRAVMEASLAERAGALPPWPAADLPATPPAGTLAATAPLTAFTWREVFDLHLASCNRERAAWEGDTVAPGPGDRLRGILYAALRAPLELFLARLPPLPAPGPGAPPARPEGFVERLAAAAAAPALLSGRLICLAEVAGAGRTDLLRPALAEMEAEGIDTAEINTLYVEAELRDGNFEAAHARATDGLVRWPPGEHEWFRVRQVARVARRWGRPDLATPWQTEWLDRYPDSQESGPVWLELAVDSMRAGDGATAARAVARARLLLGEVPTVDKVERMLAAEVAA